MTAMKCAGHLRQIHWVKQMCELNLREGLRFAKSYSTHEKHQELSLQEM